MLYEKIKVYIEHAGIKQNYIAEKIGVSPAVLSAMLTGKRNIIAEEYFSICAALGVSVGMFIDEAS